MNTSNSYLAVDPSFFEIIESEKTENKLCVVNFFGEGAKVDGAKGLLSGVTSPDGFAKYLKLENQEPIRIDRIITINGKPGPAFDEYDSYALACLTCMGGMD